MANHPSQSDHSHQELYALLRRLAADRMNRERANHTLDATAVVHEAWLRVHNLDTEIRDDRNHFVSIAATTIRRVLVDHARARNAEKRGGERQPVGLVTAIEDQTRGVIDVLILDDALERLAQVNADCARVVELRFFGGLTLEETAEALDIGRSSVVRLWRGAKAWLKNELGDQSGEQIH